MRPAALALTVGGALVALGGIYLFLEVRQPATQPAADVVAAEARRAPAPAATRPSPTAPTPRPDRARTRSSAAEIMRKVPTSAADLAGDGDAARPVLATPDLSAETSDHLLEANKLYDRGDFDGARALAIKLLNDAPGNVKLLRVVVSSACILGDPDVANKYAPQLPEADRAQMADRCAKYQIALAGK
ncbi:MAG: hypothetical protein R3B06_09620 [Kofleriaceae bacterium]